MCPQGSTKARVRTGVQTIIMKNTFLALSYKNSTVIPSFFNLSRYTKASVNNVIFFNSCSITRRRP